MKKFINNPDVVVDEMVEGFLYAHGDRIRKLDEARTLVRADAPVKGKVGIVTGGGSGHKPSFIGYIGKGMLDAVAVGEIFTSPPPGAVYEAIKATDGGKGVLLLLGNYAGDVMNFDMAAELARGEGIEVEQSIATDDVGSGFKDDKSKRRGVVGEFLIWKMTGAMAERGEGLSEVKRIADKVNQNTRTMGVAISPCTVPAAGRPTFTLADDEMEVGVGHHGEPGLKREELRPVDEIVDMLCAEVIPDLPFEAGDEVVTLINGLGATPQLELYIANRRLFKNVTDKGIRIYRALVGEFFTALEMAGFSITLCRLDDELKELLDAEAYTPYFTQAGR
ncbi:MAG: dihydroxyacetone kinase subunit DhaK [Firmicutes bacterium]|nr:dihydroxyacetone kinase subunit DhaK [Bacillota bacterium]NPV52377.1 dihydroxyacetone kinase subunit DhaK [Bacillota bacterium]